MCHAFSYQGVDGQLIPIIEQQRKPEEKKTRMRNRKVVIRSVTVYRQQQSGAHMPTISSDTFALHEAGIETGSGKADEIESDRTVCARMYDYCP